MKRFVFLLLAVAGFPLASTAANAPGAGRPNFILLMSDDQGWGDAGYNGHPLLKTPHLDAMAREGVRLDRFYAAAPVCSPTRGSCMTGRHPSRYGLNWASEGRLPAAEVTLAEALREAGYKTGHFGKWHLGQLSRTLTQGRKNKASTALYSPPWDNGFTTCFSTSESVPTFNPYFYSSTAERYDLILQQDAETVGTEHRWSENYWTGPGQFVDEVLSGDDSKLLVDRALEFIGASKGAPFFACIWFHTPHAPIVAGKEWRALYPNLSRDQQHYFGSISAMDSQVGRLRSELRRRGMADNTVVFFCSDNGPTYAQPNGSAGPFRGRKASLLEGGIRVPAIVEWPNGLAGGRTVQVPLVTSDFYPTLLALAGARVKAQPVLDGIDVLPILAGKSPARGSPVFFLSPLKNENDPWAQKDAHQVAIQTDRHKVLTLDSGKTWALYDLVSDPGEENDLAAAQPGLVSDLRGQFARWRASCERSAQGADYR